MFSEEHIKNRRKRIRELNNAWWFTHKLLGSRAKVVYGSVYNIPPEIGKVDVVTFGSILLHLRDPFLALQKAAALSPETMIITEWRRRFPRFFCSHLFPAIIRKKIIDPLFNAPTFLPDPDKKSPWDTWWFLSPELIVRYLKILGFQKTKISYHKQKFTNYKQPLFTLVGKK